MVITRRTSVRLMRSVPSPSWAVRDWRVRVARTVGSAPGSSASRANPRSACGKMRNRSPSVRSSTRSTSPLSASARVIDSTASSLMRGFTSSRNPSAPDRLRAASTLGAGPSSSTKSPPPPTPAPAVGRSSVPPPGPARRVARPLSGSARPGEPGRNSNVTSQTVIASPADNAAAPATGSPLSSVRFRLPRSSSSYPPPARGRTTAWRRETDGFSSTTAQSGCRPITVSPADRATTVPAAFAASARAMRRCGTRPGRAGGGVRRSLKESG